MRYRCIKNISEAISGNGFQDCFAELNFVHGFSSVKYREDVGVVAPSTSDAQCQLWLV